MRSARRPRARLFWLNARTLSSSDAQRLCPNALPWEGDGIAIHWYPGDAPCSGASARGSRPACAPLWTVLRAFGSCISEIGGFEMSLLTLHKRLLLSCLGV